VHCTIDLRVRSPERLKKGEPTVAHISEGGVSDVNVDPDYVAPAGMPPAETIEQGIPSAGDPPAGAEDGKTDNADKRDENDKRDDERTQRLGNDDVARPTADKLNDGGADTNTRTKPTKKTQ
jgi:hypothetical protein